MRDFESKWESHRKYLYGLLISLVRDIDLTDDLLQDVYVRANERIGTYRGGNLRAWLAAIARNTAFAHMRRAYTKAETSLVPDCDGGAQEDAGTDSHLEAMLVRNAVDDLSPLLRSALILRHYGGLNYPEVADRLNCPVGTARRRVWQAVRHLRSALGFIVEEIPVKRCNEVRLLDYAYGTLSDKERRAVDAHLEGCEACQTQLEDVRRVVVHLETVRGHMVFVDITDIEADGASTTYSSFRIQNDGGKPENKTEFDSKNYHCMKSIFIDGKEAAFTQSADGDYNHYTVQLASALAPGESTTQLVVFTTPEGVGASFDIGHGRRVAVPDNSGTDSSDYMLVQMVRLPEGAKLIGSVPVTDDIRGEGRTTLVWKRLIETGGSRERPVVVYSVE